MTDLILLALLLARPKHGYQLKREAGLLLGQEMLHNNLVYPLLRRFMKHRWVSRKTGPGQRGAGKPRQNIGRSRDLSARAIGGPD
jgi:DNA-binding PadR family transcriptional regulator